MDPKEFSTTSRKNRFAKRTRGYRCTSEPRRGGKSGRSLIGNYGKYKIDRHGVPVCKYCNPAMVLSYQRQKDGPRAIRDYHRDNDNYDGNESEDTHVTI